MKPYRKQYSISHVIILTLIVDEFRANNRPRPTIIPASYQCLTLPWRIWIDDASTCASYAVQWDDYKPHVTDNVSIGETEEGLPYSKIDYCSQFIAHWRSANIELSPVWDMYCIINAPYANMRVGAISSDQS